MVEKWKGENWKYLINDSKPYKINVGARSVVLFFLVG